MGNVENSAAIFLNGDISELDKSLHEIASINHSDAPLLDALRK